MVCRQKNFNAYNHLRYSLQNDMADVYAINITMSDGGYEFDVISKDWEHDRCEIEYGRNA